MENLKNDIRFVSEEAKALIRDEVRLGKLEAVERISSLSASIMSKAVLVILAIISYLMLLISTGFFLSEFFNEMWQGFGAAFGLSLLVITLIQLLNRYILEGPIQDFFIEKLAKQLLS